MQVLQPVIDLFRRYLSTRIGSNPELISFVFRITVLCVAIAVAVDVVNQLVFFDTWGAALRSWLISAVVSALIAAPH
jgi:hypothetical protein